MPKKYLSNIKVTIDTTTYYGLDNKNNKLLVGSGYGWKEHKKANKSVEIRLIDPIGEYVIKNTRVAGTERWEVINGQKLYNQGYHPNVRAKIVDVIHEFFLKELREQEPLPINFPITIHYHFCCAMDDRADVDNYALPYYKCFQDCLVKSNMIYNDTRKFISGFKVTSEERKEEFDELIVKIYATKT